MIHVPADLVVEQIERAFRHTPRPRPGRISDSHGEEPRLLDEAFWNRPTWKSLEPGFLDAVPDGFGTALSFFHDRAFRYYLPAWLRADVQGALQCVDPLFHVTHGICDETRHERMGASDRPRGTTWWDLALERFGDFSGPEAEGVIAYLRWRQAQDEYDLDGPTIHQALVNYWLVRDRLRPGQCR